MFEYEATTIDKSSWERGAWDDEIDEKLWVDPETQLPCFITRQPDFGFWRGYVGIPKTHFLTEVECEDLSVYGGITGSLWIDGLSLDPTLKKKLERYSWPGFDCHHSNDISPAYFHMFATDYSVYRDQAFAEANCKYLAAQIKDLMKPKETD